MNGELAGKILYIFVLYLQSSTVARNVTPALANSLSNFGVITILTKSPRLGRDMLLLSVLGTGLALLATKLSASLARTIFMWMRHCFLLSNNL